MKYLQILALSWVFLPSTYTHVEGRRVSQYKSLPQVEALPDPRETTRFYSRSWTYQRGYYRVRTSYGRPASR